MIIIAGKGKNAIHPMNKSYHEIQALKNWLLWIVLIGLLFFFTIASVSQILLGMPIGDNPLPSWALISGVLFSALFTVIMARTQLILDLDSTQFRMTFGPLGQLECNWKEIKKVSIINMPRSGYGKRQHSKYGTIYNAGGKHGMFLELKNGEKLLISTRKNSELSEFLRSIKKLKA